MERRHVLEGVDVRRRMRQTVRARKIRADVWNEERTCTLGVEKRVQVL